MKARPILIIEDEHALGAALSLLVRRMGHLPVLEASGQAGMKAAREKRFDAVVLDIGLPDMSGLKVLEQLRGADESLPVVVITAHATLQHAIDSQKSGATAYLTKPLDLQGFQQTLDDLLAPRVEMAEPPAEMPAESSTLIGAAPCLREVFLGIARACTAEVPVLISGPSGSGKSLAASVIHAHGRAGGDPATVLAAAEIREPGDFQNVRSGSLVIEEIGDLSISLQAAFANWLADPAAERPRVLATMRGDPLEAVRAGKLREDLYYALSPLSFVMPPLSARSGDIPALCAFFIGLRHEGRAPMITPPVMAALQAYEWPGNVRELRHVLDYALSMSRGSTVYLSHLPGHVAEASSAVAQDMLMGGELEAVIQRWIDTALAQPDELLPSYDDLLQQLEAKMLAYLLEKHEGKPTRLATSMRIHRGTLRQKLQRAGLQKQGDD